MFSRAGGPNSGFFISTTALTHPGKDRRRPDGQLNSNVIPFIVVLPRQASATLPGVALGDLPAVFRKSPNKLEIAVVGDVGPRRKLGEASTHRIGRWVTIRLLYETGSGAPEGASAVETCCMSSFLAVDPA